MSERLDPFNGGEESAVARPVASSERLLVALTRNDGVEYSACVEYGLREELIGSCCQGADADEVDWVSPKRVADARGDVGDRVMWDVLVPGYANGRHRSPCSAMAR
jgi:hypothetical protein